MFVGNSDTSARLLSTLRFGPCLFIRIPTLQILVPVLSSVHVDSVSKQDSTCCSITGTHSYASVTSGHRVTVPPIILLTPSSPNVGNSDLDCYFRRHFLAQWHSIGKSSPSLLNGMNGHKARNSVNLDRQIRCVDPVPSSCAIFRR